MAGSIVKAGVDALEAAPALDPFGLYLDALDASEKTRDVYRRALARYAAWLDGHGLPVQNTRREDVLAYKRDLEQTRSAATVNAYLVAVRGFYAWLDANGWHPNVARDVKGVKHRAATGRDALTLEQARGLISDGADTLEEKRNLAMINLMLRRGLRTVEVSRADVGDLRNIGGQAVLYVQGKGHASKDDFVVLGDAVAGPIRDYLAARGPAPEDAPLFASVGNRSAGGRLATRTISRIVKGAYARHGIQDPHITAHSLRHTAVTLALKAGATVQEAQAMARHANISTTMVYAHNLDRMEARAESSLDGLLAG